MASSVANGDGGLDHSALLRGVERLSGRSDTGGTGTDGTPVEAQWRLGEDGTAVVESVRASGLSLAGGAARP